MVDYLGEALLFFDLLVDEPLQEDVGRVVAFLQGWLPDGLEHDVAPSVCDEVEQLQSMGAKCRSTRPMQNIAPIATSHKKKAVPLN